MQISPIKEFLALRDWFWWYHLLGRNKKLRNIVSRNPRIRNRVIKYVDTNKDMNRFKYDINIFSIIQCHHECKWCAKKRNCNAVLFIERGKKCRGKFFLCNLFGSLFIANTYENAVVGTQIFGTQVMWRNKRVIILGNNSRKERMCI